MNPSRDHRKQNKEECRGNIERDHRKQNKEECRGNMDREVSLV
jgi:hypothetical protein